jgi:hypothetical protein
MKHVSKLLFAATAMLSINAVTMPTTHATVNDCQNVIVKTGAYEWLGDTIGKG